MHTLVLLIDDDPHMLTTAGGLLAQQRSLRAMVRETGALGYIMKSDMGADFPQKVKRFLETLPPRDVDAY